MGHRTKASAAAAVALIASGAMALPAWAAPPQATHLRVVFGVSGDPAATFTGAINDTGIDVQISARQTGRVGHGVDDLQLSKGSIFVKSIIKENDVFDSTACTLTITGRGTYEITGGTQAYAGIKGQGKFTTSGAFTFPKAGSDCNFDTGPIGGNVFLSADGVVKL